MEKKIEDIQIELKELRQKEAEEIVAEINALLAKRGAQIVPIVKIIGNQITADWGINIK